MRIRSNVDWWIALLIWFAIAIMFFSMLAAKSNDRTLVYLISLPSLGFMLWIYFGTYYELRDEYLYCRSGPFVTHVLYTSVKTIKLSRNPISSMALSTKRIEITYASKNFFGGLVYISPIDREGFMAQLLERCPQAKTK